MRTTLIVAALLLFGNSYAAPDTSVKNVQAVTKEKAPDPTRSVSPPISAGPTNSISIAVNSAAQPPSMSEKTEAANDHGGNSGQHDHWGNKSEFWLFIATVALSFFTLGLAIYTGFLYRATVIIAGDSKEFATNSSGMTKAIERAYVKISHRPPGVWFLDDAEQPGLRKLARASFEIKNFGSTPAKLTKAYVRLLIIRSQDPPPPKDPEYREGGNKLNIGEAFLVKEEQISTILESPIGIEDHAKIISGEWKLCAVGYVDYIDVFDVHHRGGYARMYYPANDALVAGLSLDQNRNNLVFVEFDGYNYDRQRNKNVDGENHDWKD